MRINTNISAIIANHNLAKTDTRMSKSMERLSSGYKINRAEDDSAGIAIAAKMHTQIRLLEQASRNGNDGISVVETAEAALNEVENMVQRMRELAVQGATETNSDVDREAIQKEVSGLRDEILRVSQTTQFNGVSLLDGSVDRRSYCVPRADATVLTTSDYVPADMYGIKIVEGDPAVLPLKMDTELLEEGKVSKIHAGTITLSNVGADATEVATVEIKEGDTAETVRAALETAIAGLGTGFTYSNNIFTAGNSTSDIQISFSNAGVAGLYGNSTTDTLISEPTRNVEFPIDTVTGQRIGFSGTAKGTVTGEYVTLTDTNGFNIKMKVDKGFYDEISIDVTDMGTMPIQIGIAEGEVIDVRIPAINLETLGIAELDCTTSKGCDAAMEQLDSAINFVSSVRSRLGAYQNRMESAVASTEVAHQSMNDAVSRIEDTDMAEEMTNYTQLNVLSQAGISMIAQANERPQMVLQLLQ